MFWVLASTSLCLSSTVTGDEKEDGTLGWGQCLRLDWTVNWACMRFM